jgi:hydrogenase expression/formation protein HypE
MRIEETSIPIEEAVRGACEILGFDPLYVANEGRFAVFLPEPQAERALEILRSFEVCRRAARIGSVTDGQAGMVVVRTSIGGSRVLDMLSGEQLPRIC